MNPLAQRGKRAYFIYAGAIALAIILTSAVWSYVSRDDEKTFSAQIQLKDDFLTQISDGAMPASLLGNCKDNLLFAGTDTGVVDCGQNTPIDLNN